MKSLVTKIAMTLHSTTLTYTESKDIIAEVFAHITPENRMVILKQLNSISSSQIGPHGYKKENKK